MSDSYEAQLYRTLVDVNTVTKSNIGANLVNAVASGSLAIDDYLLKQVLTVVNSTVDQSTDTLHTQVLRIKNTETSRKKPTGRKTTK